MLKLPTKVDIKTLEAFEKQHSLSIYAPYIPSNSSNNPNRTQLKNFLKEARQMLLAKKLSPPEINALLQPADKLLDSNEFQLKFEHSLAVFVGQDFFQHYHLPPAGIKPSMTIGKKFIVKPITDLLDDNLSYLVLLLSHNGARLLKGDRYSIEQLHDFPTHMKEDLRIDEYPRERQTHMVAPAGQGKGAERLHEQYDKTQVDKMLLIKFFRHIDSKLHKIIKGERLPLIMAGVDYLLPIYRKVNSYPHLLTCEMKGNLEHAALNFIKNRAYNLMIQTQ